MRDTYIELTNPTMESGCDQDYYFQNSSFDEGESDLDMGFVETNFSCLDPLMILMIREGSETGALEYGRELRESTEQIITQRCVEQQWRHDDEIREEKASVSKFTRIQNRIKLIKAQKGATK